MGNNPEIRQFIPKLSAFAHTYNLRSLSQERSHYNISYIADGNRMRLIDRIASDEVLDQAFGWMCEKRAHHHFNSDVWQVRRWWHEKKLRIQQLLRAGTYQFRELRLFWGEDERVEYWSSLDALVLKAMAIVLTEHLQPHLSPRCFHLAGTGGMKAAVREVARNLPQHEFVFRTDVKGYYASINHQILMEIVGRYVQDEAVLALLWGYLRRYVSEEGKFIDITQGISLGCPLSPLMGALFLKPLDDKMAELGCFYVRYMDDWVILAPTRWKLRRAIKAVNEVMNALLVEKHPDKTFMGRIARGFDFLGYFFSPMGLGIAMKTVARMQDLVSRLYEQGADEFRIEMYVRRWWLWVKGGVQGKVDFLGCDRITYGAFALRSRTLHELWVLGKVDFLGCDRICVREVKNQIERTSLSGRSHYMSKLRSFRDIPRRVC